MANRNRTKGHNWEREVRKRLLPIFPDCVTSRSESLSDDAKGLDLCYTGDFKFQCKNYAKNLDWEVELDYMKTNMIKVIAFKHNKYRSPKGELAILRLDDFIEILKKL